MIVVAGIDCSQTATAVCAVPEDWGQDFTRVKTMVTGYGLKNSAGPWEHSGRLLTIGKAVVAFIQKVEATHLYIEAVPLHVKHGAALVGSVIGAVTYALALEGKFVQMVTTYEARRLLIANPNGAGAKDAVHATLKELGRHWTTRDESDAFAVANWGLEQLEASAVVIPHEEPARKSKSRRAAA